MSRSHHIAKITSGAAIEHVRSYLLSEAARLGLGEEVDAADCRKLLALLQDMRRSLETLERRGGLVVVSSTQTLITTYRCEGYRPQRKPHRCSPHLSMSERGFIKGRASCTPTAPCPRLPSAPGKTRPEKANLRNSGSVPRAVTMNMHPAAQVRLLRRTTNPSNHREKP